MGVVTGKSWPLDAWFFEFRVREIMLFIGKEPMGRSGYVHSYGYPANAYKLRTGR